MGRRAYAGVAQWFVRLLAKQDMRVRFPSPAPNKFTQYLLGVFVTPKVKLEPKPIVDGGVG